MIEEPLKSHISANIFLYIPENLSEISDPYIMFFITGNPGLISYYHSFLSLLSTTAPTSAYIIAGFSLGGFDIPAFQGDEPVPAAAADIHKSFNERDPPSEPYLSLQRQITLVECRLIKLLSRVRSDYFPTKSTWKPKVILVGHSVGAYIALEIIRRNAEKRVSAPSDTFEPASSIVSAILLTPTVVDIAKSDSGRILTPLITYITFFPAAVAYLAKTLVWALPPAWLRALVGKVTGMPTEVSDGTSALDATIALLRTENVVWQCLNMSGDEMREIGKDRWGEEVWGSIDTGAAKFGKPPTLIFYFAAKDHWVGDVTREGLSRARGRLAGSDISQGEDWKPKMIVDVGNENEGALVHGWCIRQSGSVAKKVAGWTTEIVGLAEKGK